MTYELIMIGGGSHARCLRPVVDGIRYVVDPKLPTGWSGDLQANVVDEQVVMSMNPHVVRLVNGVGRRDRCYVFMKWWARGYRFSTVRHGSVWLPRDLQCGEGVQFMLGCLIQPHVRIGCNVLINTGAQVDHDCVIGDHVHVAPGAVLCGGVHVDAWSMIGAGAVILPNLHVGPGVVVPAGMTVREQSGWLSGQETAYPRVESHGEGGADHVVPTASRPEQAPGGAQA